MHVTIDLTDGKQVMQQFNQLNNSFTVIIIDENIFVTRMMFVVILITDNNG